MPVDATVHPLDIHEKFMSLENPGLIEIESSCSFSRRIKACGIEVPRLVTRPKMVTIKYISTHLNEVTVTSGSIFSISRNTVEYRITLSES